MENTTYKFVRKPTERYPVLTILNGHIVFRNFAGMETTKNKAGDKNFCVVIDDHDFARSLIADGWNCKQFRKRDDDPDEPNYYIPVAVVFGDDRFPIKVSIINDDGSMAPLDNVSVSDLDSAHIKSCDISIRQRHWGDNGGRIKAYLCELRVRLEEDVDEFAE